MSLRILTQNLFNGRAHPDALAQVLGEYEPDVVAVQELSTNSAEVLATWGATTLLDPRDDTTGMGLAVRGTASLSRLDFPHRDPIRALLTAAEWGLDTDVEIVNAHVVNPIARPIRHSLRLRRAELAELEALLQREGAPQSRVLVGDLNSSPAWPVYRRLAALATDAAVVAGAARRTWGPRPASPRMLRIDHAFVRGVKVIDAQLINVAGSDHRGLLVELEPVR